MKPVLRKGFFSEQQLQPMQAILHRLKGPEGLSLGVMEDREIFFRKSVRNYPMFLQLLGQLTDEATSIFGVPVKPTATYVSMYDEDRSICPIHVDKPYCQFTIDVCLNTKEVWPLFIDGEPYELSPGDAVCYSGTGHPHYRNQIAPGNFCDMVFFHYVQI